MTPEEHARIREVYDAASALADLEAQEAFVERECRDNPELRDQVRQLLAARRRAPAWLDQPLAAAAAALPRIEGRILGDYRVIREIGRGGMGAVYLAERSDGAFRKQVAIKLVQPGVNTPQIIARFQQERQILASLDHPNIARLLDGGATEEGWPYFVMEYVDGQPIHRWCDDRKLGISQRIELFRSVLAAVQYAHQHLVVHRDLKPGNVLVTNEGAVKLLDFGIAKLLTPTEAGTERATETLAQMMTPDYASPEQIRGAHLTTLTDVYSLGVVLYELLTGHRPYRLRSAAVHEMARVVAEVDPPLPSQMVATTEPGAGRDAKAITPESVSAVREGDLAHLRRRLAGDLDSVLLMALRKEPGHRYSSAEAFAGDLQRHLEHLPVTAREATPWYRAMRYCRRHPGGVAAGVPLAILTLGGLASVTWQGRLGIDATNAGSNGGSFLGPMLAYFWCIGLGALSATIYLVRPDKWKFLGAAAGGAVWAVSVLGRQWMGHSMGWWHSTLAGTPDPLLYSSPATVIVHFALAPALMLALTLAGRRFGWKGQAVCIGASGFYIELRERVWLTTFLPMLTYQPGILPILLGAAMLSAGAALGLLVMRLIAGPDRPAAEPR